MDIETVLTFTLSSIFVCLFVYDMVFSSLVSQLERKRKVGVVEEWFP